MSTIKANIIDSTTPSTEFKDTITANGDKQWVDSYGVIKTNRTTISENVTIPADTNGLSSGPIVIAEGRRTQINVFEHQAEEGETWTLTSEHIRDQQLDPAKLVPILTAALKESIAKIESLEARLDAAGL